MLACWRLPSALSLTQLVAEQGAFSVSNLSSVWALRRTCGGRVRGSRRLCWAEMMTGRWERPRSSSRYCCSGSTHHSHMMNNTCLIIFYRYLLFIFLIRCLTTILLFRLHMKIQIASYFSGRYKKIQTDLKLKREICKYGHQHSCICSSTFIRPSAVLHEMKFSL